MTISSLTIYGIPPGREETATSNWVRPITIAIGLITLFSGVFIGWRIPLPVASVALVEPPATPCTPSEDGNCFLSMDAISVDMCLHIASFLTIRERVNMMGVSRQWCEIARSNLFWRPFLGHEVYRIWGAASSTLVRHHDMYTYTEEDLTDWSAFHQFRVYHDLHKRGLAGINEEFFDYLARLMPGGPLAFDSIPYVRVENASEVTAESMVASVIRGSDGEDNIFFALRLLDQALDDQNPVVLLFVNKGGKWIQEANAYWPKGAINLLNQNDQNYILALLGGTTLSNRECFNAPQFKKTLQLVNVL